MRTLDVTIPELAFVAGTRGMAGAGIGMLAAGFLKDDTRRAVGWTLVAIGLLTTVPIAIGVFGRTHPQPPAD